MSLTIFLASFVASRGSIGEESSVGEVFETLEKEGDLSGREDIKEASSSVWPWDRRFCICRLAQSRLFKARQNAASSALHTRCRCCRRRRVS